MCRMCLVLEDVGGGVVCDMKKQCDDCSESHTRHRLSLMTRVLVMNLWPGQIMNTFVALLKKTTTLTSRSSN